MTSGKGSASISGASSSGYLRDTLGLLILRALADEPRHGYAIMRWLESTSAEALRIDEGALYPALHRLEDRGWVSSEWGLSESNRRARYYRLTRTGRTRLRRELDRWRQHARAVERILGAEDA
ncbi:MAG TPA: PadR family transcriptional regulator [Thermoanaerobaculia bacterium]|nr:PadR family transcriptional regulator [Thermoanaerobaculia bacterium]